MPFFDNNFLSSEHHYHYHHLDDNAKPSAHGHNNYACNQTCNGSHNDTHCRNHNQHGERHHHIHVHDHFHRHHEQEDCDNYLVNAKALLGNSKNYADGGSGGELIYGDKRSNCNNTCPVMILTNK